MALLERRIGLLFAAFLVLLAPRRRARALRLGTVKGRARCQRAPPRQQVSHARAAGAARHDHRPPRRRARGLRARRRHLARRRTWSRTRSGGRASSRRCSAPTPGRASCASSRQRDTGFVYLARALPAGQARGRSQKLEHRGHHSSTPAHRRVYPRDVAGRRRCSARSAPTATACRGLEYARRQGAARRRRRAPPRQRRARPADLDRATSSRAQPGARPRADARRRDPGQGRAGARRASAQTYRPKGATAIVMDPHDRRDPRAGQLAADRRQRPRRRARLRARRTAPSASPTSPARRSRRSPSPARCRTARSRPSTPFDLPPQIQVADRTIGESHDARLRDADDRADPRAVEQRRRDQDRPEAGHASASTTGCARFGFGTPTGVDLPGEERGHRAPARASTRARRWATCRSARASRSRRCRWRTAYAAIANGGILRPPHIVRRVDGKRDADAARARGSSRRRPRAQLRDDARGRASRPGGTASEVSIPGYELAGKTGTANKIDPATGEYSEHAATSPRSSASRRPTHPQLLSR